MRPGCSSSSRAHARDASRSGCASTARGSTAKQFHTLRAPETYAGDTRGAGNLVSRYRYPTDATSFGLPRLFDGPEQLFRFHIDSSVVNAGVSVVAARGVVAYPILLRARDENAVAGQSGLPLNVGPLPSDESIVPAAGLDFPPAGDYWVTVESPPGEAGHYSLKLWVNDVAPPVIEVLGQTVARGRRVLRVHITDAGSGVNWGGVTVSGAGLGHRSLTYDVHTGIATIDLDRLNAGRHLIRILAPDLAETKDVLSATARRSNTATRVIRLTVPD